MSDMLGIIAGITNRSPHLPKALKSAISFACTARRPIRTVSALAYAVSCDRSTLWRQWDQLKAKDDPSLRSLIRLIEALQINRLLNAGNLSESANRAYTSRLTKLCGSSLSAKLAPEVLVVSNAEWQSCLELLTSVAVIDNYSVMQRFNNLGNNKALLATGAIEHVSRAPIIPSGEAQCEASH